MSAKIVVIDDDPRQARAVRRILESDGYRVGEANRGQDGLRLVEESQPKLVICDLMMPEMDGVETIVVLREDFPSVKVLAMSGARVKGWDPLEDADLLGADASLLKPFSSAELLAAVKKLLGSPPSPK